VIALVDLGLGNLRSVEKALAAAASEAGVESPTLTDDPEVIARADRVVVPGQGAFRDGAAALARNGGALGSAILEAIARGTPYLGICLGLQLLFEESEEAPGARGLAAFPGRVVRIPDGLLDAQGRRLKVPHMGWNQPVVLDTRAGKSARSLLEAAGEAPWFYFVHSFQALPDDPQLVAATASYGCLEITAAIDRGPLLATQFHPEKSQRAGLALLRAFLSRRA
jgi:glutamine amidotransferase